jgi:hypothetical protein
MNTNKLNDTPLWHLSLSEFVDVIEDAIINVVDNRFTYAKREKYVYGIGIAELFDCSIAIGDRIKRSGIIDETITQINRKIIIDKEKAFEISKQHQTEIEKL